jgi:hypothetical protein
MLITWLFPSILQIMFIVWISGIIVYVFYIFKSSIAFKRMDDDHKENIEMLINFNYGKCILIRKYHVHMWYEILTNSATILAREKTSDDGCIWQKHVTWNKGDQIISCIKDGNLCKINYILMQQDA